MILEEKNQEPRCQEPKKFQAANLKGLSKFREPFEILFFVLFLRLLAFCIFSLVLRFLASWFFDFGILVAGSSVRPTHSLLSTIHTLKA